MNHQFLIDSVGKKRGHFTNKANRAAKLIEIWPQLEAKFDSFIQRGRGTTYQARLAYAALLMMETGIRTGNESSAEGWKCENQIVAKKSDKKKGVKKGDVIWRHPLYGQHVQTFGLTTLLHKHVTRNGRTLKIDFVGKKLVDQNLVTKHPTLVKFCPRGTPDDLFLGITYAHFKQFVKRSVGRGYTPKDLRMAKANLIFIHKFSRKPYTVDMVNATTKSAKKKVLAAAIEDTANVIGHTKSVCRSAYLSHPLIETITQAM